MTIGLRVSGDDCTTIGPQPIPVTNKASNASNELQHDDVFGRRNGNVRIILRRFAERKPHVSL